MSEKKAMDFMWYVMFGVEYERAKDMDNKKLTKICAQRAYRDLSRTLKFGKSGDALKSLSKTVRDTYKKTKSAFNDKVCDYICEQITCRMLLCASINEFDKIHTKVWSKWDGPEDSEMSFKDNNSDYASFQKIVREAINKGLRNPTEANGNSYCSPIEWEFDAWIRMSKEGNKETEED